ncbi:hypothetical protein PIB30_042109 [Stylosanthes scabra]|uniref:Uncharacterized protein n=1 Tax=Stylosanthes scabra TaxID=79078 RepID=A0ABU6UH63_9FABA|nr:hypothetical protein [Stylosanthes scabra]
MSVGGGGGDYYSPATSGGHNFYTGAPIDAPFAVTRSSSPPLRFYPNIKRMVKLDRVMGMKDCAWVLNGAEETAYVQFELGIQEEKVLGVLWKSIKSFRNVLDMKVYVFKFFPKMVFRRTSLIQESTLTPPELILNRPEAIETCFQSAQIDSKCSESTLFNPEPVFRPHNRFSHLQNRF